MVTDWFAGREIVVAMGIFVNSFPLGIGLALISLTRLVGAAGWSAAMQATAVLSLAALLLMVLAYRRHSIRPQPEAATKFVPSISAQEAAMVSLVGIIWGLLNGVYSIYLASRRSSLGAAASAPPKRASGGARLVARGGWRVSAAAR
jgi:cyanate permease